jgi:type I restriction enzyme R subunit
MVRTSLAPMMATGTGKTLLCAALIRRFLRTRNAERVLFVVDRIELAKQTMEDFAVILPEFKPVIFRSARRTGERLGASVVVTTIQSLMVDRRTGKSSRLLFRSRDPFISIS